VVPEIYSRTGRQTHRQQTVFSIEYFATAQAGEVKKLTVDGDFRLNSSLSDVRFNSELNRAGGEGRLLLDAD